MSISELNKGLLNKENQALFDWLTGYLVAKPSTETAFVNSMIQGLACYNPNGTYWDHVKEVKLIIEQRPELVAKVKAAYGISST